MKPRFLSNLAAIPLFAAVVLAQPRGFPRVPVPAGNPITVAKTLLGKALFFEEQMSSSRTMACATCHIFSAGGSDPRADRSDSIHPGLDGRVGTADDIHGSKGQINSLTSGKYQRSNSFGLREQVTGRRAPTVINAAFARRLFWDGRADEVFRGPITNQVVLNDDAALESQAVGPPVSDVEMCSVGDTWTEVMTRIKNARPLALATNIPAPLAAFIGTKSYPELFNVAFGTTAVTPKLIAFAIATYERTLISNQSAFDDFQRGNQNALNASQRRGFDLFRQRCDACHEGPLTTDHRFRNTGVRPIIEDNGRQGVTNQRDDRGKFKTPTIRNVELRAPYFHNGQMETLMDVVDFYNRGGDFNDNKNRQVQRLGWNRGQRQDVVNFMLALTDPRVRNETGPFTRPRLYTESNRIPTVFGDATDGSSGATPRVIAVQPPFVGSPGMTLGMNRGQPNAPALLLIDGVGNQAGVMVLGARIHVGLSAGLIVVSYGALNDRGYGSMVFPIPNNASLRGLPLFGQWVIVDSGLSGALAATRAFSTRLF